MVQEKREKSLSIFQGNINMWQQSDELVQYKSIYSDVPVKQTSTNILWMWQSQQYQVVTEKIPGLHQVWIEILIIWKIFMSEHMKSGEMETWLKSFISTSKGREIYQVKKILTEYFNINLDLVYIYMVTKTIKWGGRNCYYNKISI